MGARLSSCGKKEGLAGRVGKVRAGWQFGTRIEL